MAERDCKLAGLFFLLLALLPAGVSAGAPVITSPEPIVYTGALLYNNSDRAMLARMFVLPGSGESPFEAHVILYHGSFDTREYVPLVFEKIEPHGENQYLLTSSRMTGTGMPLRHPVIEMSAPGDDTVEGVFNSGVQTKVGVLRLAKGWELPDGIVGSRQVAQSFEGNYFGDCPAPGRGDMLKGIEIYSTRSQLEDMAMMPGIDTSVEANSYQGGTICRDPDGFTLVDELACGGFSSGHYDHYAGKLMLYVTPAWKWTCDFDPVADSLICETVRYRRCELFRMRERTPAIFDQRGAMPASMAQTPEGISRAAAMRSPDPLPAEKPCEPFGRRIPGLLHHMWTGLYQRVALDLSVIQAGTPRTCKLSGILAQGFGKDAAAGANDLTHVIDPLTYNLDQPLVRIAAGQMGDAVLVLKREGLHFSGYWYSRLFGLVGKVEFDPAMDYSALNELEFVPSVAGLFLAQPQNGVRMIRTLALSAFTDSLDSRSFNPVRQQPTNGILKSEVVDPDGQGYGLQTIQEIQPVVYDYFTGRVVFSTQSAQYHGSVLPRGLNLRMITTHDGSNYMPRGQHWEFERQPAKSK